MPESRQPPDLWTVVVPGSLAIAMAALGLLLGTLRQINPTFRFQFDGLSVLVTALAGASGWLLGRGFGRLGKGEVTGPALKRLRLQMIVGLLLLGVATILAFSLAGVGLPEGRRRDMAIGAAFAAGAIGMVGMFIWLLARLFGNPDDPESGGAP